MTDLFEPDAALVPLLDDWTIRRLGLVDEQIRRASQRVGHEGGSVSVGGLYVAFGPWRSRIGAK